FRIVWSCIYIIFIVLTIGLVLSLWQEFLTNPTVTTLESTYLPVNKIPYPGIAICNMNKISKKKATVFAKHVAQFTKLDVVEIVNKTQMLGKLYDFSYNKEDKPTISMLQNIVEKLQLNIITVMKMLTLQCEDLLLKCRWKGVDVNCSNIFKLRLTYDGYCCTFNYAKKTLHFHEGEMEDFPITGEAGVDKGLSVTINNEIEDYMYAPLYSQGVTIQIFIPTDYPDKPSGSLTEIVGEVGTENFLKIKPTTVKTVGEVIKYPLNKRQCLFDEERPTKFNGVYSQSDCNVDCRIASTLALCQCIPFMIPLSTTDSVCTLNNLACLHQYRNKWNFLYPEQDDLGLLQREQHDSLRCSQTCYPSCDATLYDVVSERAIIHKHKSRNHTVVHIYYYNRFSNLYKHDVVYYWFEILSNFGGTFGLIIGLSLISIVECLLFMLQYLLNLKILS
ncbi:unnamed protein product, partial [Tenebrio molitor]